MPNQSISALQRLIEVFPEGRSMLDPLGVFPEEFSRKLPLQKRANPIEKDDQEATPLDAAIAPIGYARSPTRMVERSFGFLDLVGFTSTIAKMDADETTALLTLFRALVQEVAAARGCRISNWVGDGVLIIGVEPKALVATMVELSVRLSNADIPAATGVTKGSVLLFLGSDHIGTPVNLAARLSDLAHPGQVLADDAILNDLPDWVIADEKITVKVKGLGKMKVTPLRSQ